MSKLQSLVGELLKWWWPDETILVNHRPDWLFGMEMDFYIPNLRLAIEVQGRQHRYFCPTFHPTQAHFIAQKQRDARKSEIIRNRGIRLVCIHESTKRRALGLPRLLRQWYDGTFYVPTFLRIQFREHSDLLYQNHVHKNVAFKVTQAKPIMAFNTPSKQFLASNRHILTRSPSATTATASNALARVKHGQMVQTPAG